MSTRLRAAALGGLAVFALAGCSSPTQGVAEPSAPAPSPGGQAVDLPSRPKEMPLAGIDPCTLFTEQQLDELKVNSEPRSRAGREGQTCSLGVNLTEPYYSYNVEAVTTADLQDWLTGGHHNASLNTEPTQVGGFPALTSHAKGSSPSDCETLVGVARGQTLRAQMYPESQGAFDQKQLCDMAKQVATMAVETLQTRN
ncbi:DUF3558 domain-containing protein [Amycolatopsis nigrescens]|uniref:DUF3558 domain-containing protein n=1 Tax=Amycolatopsis nigrescens TaxID=381445 RepID=UPI0007C4B08E|nr:DUF3558 domain-containing protein [Amycolatopsis nigrescens]